MKKKKFDLKKLHVKSFIPDAAAEAKGGFYKASEVRCISGLSQCCETDTCPSLPPCGGSFGQCFSFGCPETAGCPSANCTNGTDCCVQTQPPLCNTDFFC